MARILRCLGLLFILSLASCRLRCDDSAYDKAQPDKALCDAFAAIAREGKLVRLPSSRRAAGADRLVFGDNWRLLPRLASGARLAFRSHGKLYVVQLSKMVLMEIPTPSPKKSFLGPAAFLPSSNTLLDHEREILFRHSLATGETTILAHGETSGAFGFFGIATEGIWPDYFPRNRWERFFVDRTETFAYVYESTTRRSKCDRVRKINLSSGRGELVPGLEELDPERVLGFACDANEPKFVTLTENRLVVRQAAQPFVTLVDLPESHRWLDVEFSPDRSRMLLTGTSRNQATGEHATGLVLDVNSLTIQHALHFAHAYRFLGGDKIVGVAVGEYAGWFDLLTSRAEVIASTCSVGLREDWAEFAPASELIDLSCSNDGRYFGFEIDLNCVGPGGRKQYALFDLQERCASVLEVDIENVVWLS